jgi:hypothetical protein
MIIENQAMVTDAVIEAVDRTEDPRLREILLALVRRLHGFVREFASPNANSRRRWGLSRRWARRPRRSEATGSADPLQGIGGGA